MLSPDVSAVPLPQVKRSLSRIRIVIGLALAALSAALLTLAFPPHNYGLLIWIGFIPMLLAQYWVMPGRCSSIASAAAIGGWLGILLVPIFGSKGIFFALVPLVIGVTVFFVDKGKRSFHRRTGYRWFVLEGVVGWVGLEMIRGLVPAIGTWAFVGYPLWNYPWLLQPLSIFGIYALDLLILLCNYVLAQAIFILVDRRWPGGDHPSIERKSGVRALCLLGILLIGWVGLSTALYWSRPLDPPTVTAAAVQPNLPRAAHRDTQTAAEQRLAVLSAQTRDAAARGARLVVWPEMALGFDPQIEYTEVLQALAAETGTTLVIGYVLETDQGFRNEAAVLAPSGDFLGVYGKNRPMIASGEPKTTTSGIYPVYETPLGRLATMICFDAHFTEISRRIARQRAQLIANPSLFGPPIAELPYTQIVFRAIENRVAIIMADVAYNSAAVDPYGRILALSVTPQGEAVTLVADVPLGTGNTFYSRYGDWAGWLSLIGLIFFAVYIPVTMRRT
jgi:apolipoprotein N-acyltransferase